MKTYQTKASIEVLPNGKTEVLYEVSDGYYAELDTFLKEKEERGKEAVKAVKTIGKKEKVKAFLKKYMEAKRAKKEAKKKSEPAFPLVSKDQYKKHLELLRLSFQNSMKPLDKQKKPKVADRPLYKELEDAFVRDSWPSSGSRKDTAQAFLNGLTHIYNKKSSKGSLSWLDWFDASKTGQAEGNEYIQSDNYSDGALGKYFNIYPSEKGTIEMWPRKMPGYFFGYA